MDLGGNIDLVNETDLLGYLFTSISSQVYLQHLKQMIRFQLSIRHYYTKTWEIEEEDVAMEIGFGLWLNTWTVFSLSNSFYNVGKGGEGSCSGNGLTWDAFLSKLFLFCYKKLRKILLWYGCFPEETAKLLLARLILLFRKLVILMAYF